MAVRLVNESLPNVMAWSWIEKESGTKFMLYKSTPGDTTPRLAMRGFSTEVVFPERYGSYDTAKEFKAWCERFVAEGQSGPRSTDDRSR